MVELLKKNNRKTSRKKKKVAKHILKTSLKKTADNSKLPASVKVQPELVPEIIQDVQGVNTSSLTTGNKWLKNRIAKEFIPLLFFPLIVFTIYFNSLHAPFLFDDNINIVDNTSIRISSLSLESLRKAVGESHSVNRSVSNISFALNYLIHKYNVVGFHIANILIHIVNGLLLYFLIKATLSSPILKERYEHLNWVPFITALIWLVNPLHIQSVTYIVQRMNSLATMFYLISFVCYIHGRISIGKKRWILFSLATLSGVLSIGSKEMTVVLPLFIVLYEAFFFQELSRDALKKTGLVIVAALVFVAIMALLFLGNDPIDILVSGYKERPFTLGQRLLTEPRVVLFYLSLLFFPHPSRLSILHDFSLSTSLFSPVTTICSIIVIGGLIFFAMRFARHTQLLSFCIIWYFGNIFIESSFIPLEIVFEHRSYLPSMMIVLLLVLLSKQLVKVRFLQYGLLIIVIISSCFWTYSRNAIWSDKVSFWSDAVSKFPSSSRARLDLGNALYESGRSSEAIVQLKKAIMEDPTNATALRNIGIILMRKMDFTGAIKYYEKSLAVDPSSAETHYMLSGPLVAQGRIKEAYVHCAKALRLKPGYTKARKQLENLSQMIR